MGQAIRLHDEKARGFIKDEQGTWWYAFSDGRRVRGRYVLCKSCRREFITWRTRSKYCSDSCEQSRHEHVTWIRKCHGCKKEFSTRKRGQRFCSHSCAAVTRHAAAPITTSKKDKAQHFVNGENPRYSQDSRGQWWYTPGGSLHSRTRAHIATCPWCTKKFLKSAYDLEQTFCSRKCGIQSSIASGSRGDQKGEMATNWKGGRRIARGYVLVYAPDHPTRKGKIKPYVFEHRLVMEKRLGRLLRDDEHVHHKDGVRSNNQDSNLELWTKSHPHGQRAEDKVKWAREIIALYGRLYPE